MKKLVILLLVLSGLLVGCGVGKDDLTGSISENNSYEHNIYISHTTECLRDEQKELYETMQALLLERAKLQYSLTSPDVDLNSENIFQTEDGLTYYPLKDCSLSIEDLRNQLLGIYEAEYVDKVLMPYYLETLRCYIEKDGQLYGQDVASVVLTLKENWTIWKVNENYYYLQGYEDDDEDVIVILTVLRSTDGVDFLISDEVEINLE